MTTGSILASGLLLAALAVGHWGFRFQRVGRGILLLARGTMAGELQRFASMMPPSFVLYMLLTPILWIAYLFLAWRAWRWYGLLAPIPFVVVRFLVEDYIPWPDHARLLRGIKRRINEGRAGVDGILLLPTIERLEAELAKGVPYEAATTDVWLGLREDPGKR